MRSLILLAMCAFPTIAAGQTASIDPEVALQYFREMKTAGAADAGSLWRRPVDGPMLLVDPVTREVVANAGDNEGVLARHGEIWRGKLPASVVPANTAVVLGGRRYSMVLWPLPDNRYSRLRLLMHESFHRIQDSLGIPMGNPSNAHMSTRAARIWTRLEWRALTEALLRDGAARRRALGDALAFRARRHRLSPVAAEEERQLELNEGLSEYTGLMLSGLPGTVLADRVAVQMAQYEPQESFVRSFAYATGPAYALLLDAAGGQWRRSLHAGSNLPLLAARAYKVGSSNADSATLIGRYSAQRMIADETARETRRLAQEAGLRSTFIDGPTLTLPVGGALNFSFDPNGASVIPGFGTVYESSRITDDWGSLEVTSGGVLILRDARGMITGFVVPAPIVSEVSVAGAGWKMTPAAGWRAAEVISKRGSYTMTR